VKQSQIDAIARAFAHHVTTGAVSGYCRWEETHWSVDLPGGTLQRMITHREAEVLCAALASAEKRARAEVL
jgi:hypothetical protein